jgi:hypothetical protein
MLPGYKILCLWRLRKDAVPCLYSINDNNLFEIIFESKSNHIDVSKMKEHERIQKRERETNILRSQLRAKCKALKKVDKKLSSGNIIVCLMYQWYMPDKDNRAWSSRFSFQRFILMQLFPSSRWNSYSTDEQRLC